MTRQRVLVLEPHNDDCALFCAFPAIDHRAHVITVLRSANQERQLGITAEEREAESAKAAAELGVTWEQWTYLDTDPDWDEIELRLGVERDDRPPALVYAPLPEPGGHDQHNEVGEIARRVFADTGALRFYTTYRLGGPRNRTGTDQTYTPEMVLRKLRALACFESQILRGPHRFWLMGLHEYEHAPG